MTYSTAVNGVEYASELQVTKDTINLTFPVSYGVSIMRVWENNYLVIMHGIVSDT